MYGCRKHVVSNRCTYSARSRLSSTTINDFVSSSPSLSRKDIKPNFIVNSFYPSCKSNGSIFHRFPRPHNQQHQHQYFHSTSHQLSVTPQEEKGIIAGLKAIWLISSRQVVSSIENGWKNGNIPITEGTLKEYIKAVVKINKLDSLDIKGLLSFLNKEAPNNYTVPSSSSSSPPPAPSSQSSSSSSQNSIQSFLSKSSSSSVLPGSSPTEPMYMTTVEPSARSQTWKLISRVAGLFLVLSFLGAVLDEKTGGAGGIASRLGVSSIVHQAEQSDKTFADVVGKSILYIFLLLWYLVKLVDAA